MKLITNVWMGLILACCNVHAADFSGLAVTASSLRAGLAAESGGAAEPKSAPAEDRSSAGRAPNHPVEWVNIYGGKFAMGSVDADPAFNSAKPVHEVTVKTFRMSKTLVTVEQYSECVARGKCSAPYMGSQCNYWISEGRRYHPINCVTWDQAEQYAKFMGARLPSEAEWEYAARSGGRDQKYPWGNEKASCARAVMYGNNGQGCGNDGTMPVCYKEAGNTAQGLCDMAGNVWQWVEDIYQPSYQNAPLDGGAVRAAGAAHGMRGGSFADENPMFLRAAYRSYDFGFNTAAVGFRLAR